MIGYLARVALGVFDCFLLENFENVSNFLNFIKSVEC